MKRDFTYIDDIINGMLKILEQPFRREDDNKEETPFRIFNIGKGSPVKLLDFVSEIEKNLNLTAQKEFFPMQDGDVVETWADVTELGEGFDYVPTGSLDNGVKHCIEWYKDYYIDRQLEPKDIDMK